MNLSREHIDIPTTDGFADAYLVRPGDGGVACTSEVYAGAAHGYTMADTAAYSSEAAERHFEALRSLLQRTIASA